MNSRYLHEIKFDVYAEEYKHVFHYKQFRIYSEHDDEIKAQTDVDRQMCRVKRSVDNIIDVRDLKAMERMANFVKGKMAMISDLSGLKHLAFKVYLYSNYERDGMRHAHFMMAVLKCEIINKRKELLRSFKF